MFFFLLFVKTSFPHNPLFCSRVHEWLSIKWHKSVSIFTKVWSCIIDAIGSIKKFYLCIQLLPQELEEVEEMLMA